MQLGQAIVSSIDSKKLNQNELIASSDDIDKPLARVLCQWSPCRNELADGQPESINFFQPNDNTLALSRSFIGGLGNTRLGGRNLVTHFVVFSGKQLSGYDHNVVLLTRVLRSMGMLMLQTSWPQKLPLLSVPDNCFQKSRKFLDQKMVAVTDKVARAIDIHRKVILIGQSDPLSFLCAFLAEISPQKRLALSFSTGLNVVDSRPFNLQFFPRTNPSFELELASRQLRTISVEPKSVPVF